MNRSKSSNFDLDTNQQLEDAANIKIAIVPVGKISNSQFQEYESLIKAFKTITVYEHGEIYDRKNTHYPQQERQGKINLNFVDRSNSSNTWEDLQSHKKTLGVIGIVHCPNWKDLTGVVKEFSTILAQIPNTCGICLSFSPLEHQRDLDHGIVVMIPNDGKLALYLSTLLIDFTKNLLEKLETMYKIIDKANLHFTPLDPKNTRDDVTRFKKKINGRILKTKGDYCLLAGSPRDALAYYYNAIDSSKSQGDWEWQAAASEAYASTLLIASKNYGFYPPDIAGDFQAEKCSKLIIEKCEEAFILYGRRCIELQIEILMKLARYYLSIHLYPETNEKLAEAYFLGESLPSLSKIHLYNSIALCYKQMNFRRKFLFYLREAALMYKENFNLPTAHCLLGITAQELLMPDLNPQLEYQIENSCKRGLYQDSPVNPKLRGWPFLQDYILDELISVTNSIGDNQTAARYLIYKLKHLRSYIDSDNQQSLANDLMILGQKQPGSLILDMVGIPYISSIIPQSLPPHLIAHQVPEDKKSDKNSGGFKFIVGIQSRKKNNTIINPWENLLWIEGQTIFVTVTLTNLLNFPIPIESISLTTDGCLFESHSLSTTIPPCTKSMEIKLSGKPLEPGKLIVKGCLIRSFNIQAYHPVNAEGIGVTVNYHNQDDLGVSLISVDILPALPVLRVNQSFLKGSKLCVFDGEECYTQIEVENIGTQPISSIKVSIDPKENEIQLEEIVAAEPKHIFEWDQSIIDKNLPLLPQHYIRIPVVIRGYKPKNGSDISATFMFEYSSENTKQFYRKHPLNCSVKVLEGLKLVNFEVLPSESNTSSVSSILASPVFNRHNLNNSQKLLMKQLGIGKQVQTMCLLMFEVVNSTSHMFWIKYYVKDLINDNKDTETVVTMAPHSGRRLMIPFCRFDISKDKIKDVILQSELRQFVRSDRNLTAEQEDTVRYHYLIKQQLIKKVQVSWKSDFQTSGILSLERLNLSTDHVMKLTPDKVTFDFKSDLSSSYLEPGNTSSLPSLVIEPYIEQFSTISTIITNCSDKPISISSNIIICEDLGNGMHNLDASQKILWNGTLNINIEQLKPNEEYKHDLNICFLTTGKFRLALSCKNKKTKEVYKCGKQVLYSITNHY